MAHQNNPLFLVCSIYFIDICISVLYTLFMVKNKQLKTGIIYLITNRVNGKVYVGTTVQGINVRWNQHWKSAERGEGWALQAAIRKYGKENFTVEEIAESFEPCLPALEIFFIALYNSTNKAVGYNVTTGGDGVPCTDEMRKKMSESQKKRAPITEETRAKLIAWQVGKVIPLEQRKKISEARIGKPLSPEHAEAKRLGQIGRKRSEEVKRNMSALAPKGENHHMWGKKHKEESRAQLSASLLKHYETNTKPPVTDETRARMSAGKKNDPELMTRMLKLADAARGRIAHNRGTTHSEETKAKMKAGWILLNQKRAVAKMKSLVKQQLLTLALEEQAV